MTYAFIHTMKFFILTAFLFVSFFIITGTKAQAYFTTGQEAVRLNDTSVLFSIEYRFGHGKNDIHMPVFAQNTTEGTTTTVSYTILDADGNQVPGTATGIVFSKAKLTKDAEYVVQKKEARAFTLMVIFTPETPAPEKEYRLQVTYLPFTFNGTHQLQLNPSELTYYTTKYIAL